MNTFETLEQALKTKTTAVIVKIRDFDHKGKARKAIQAKKARGNRIYYVTQYENGRFSEAV